MTNSEITDWFLKPESEWMDVAEMMEVSAFCKLVVTLFCEFMQRIVALLPPVFRDLMLPQL